MSAQLTRVNRTKKHNMSTDLVPVYESLELEKSAKYPFIRDFVVAMKYIGAEEKVMNELDFKSLLLFTRLYTKVIKHMKESNIDPTIENTERVMTEMFDKERDKYNLQIQTKNLEIKED